MLDPERPLQFIEQDNPNESVEEIIDKHNKEEAEAWKKVNDEIFDDNYIEYAEKNSEKPNRISPDKFITSNGRVTRRKDPQNFGKRGGESGDERQKIKTNFAKQDMISALDGEDENIDSLVDTWKERVPYEEHYNPNTYYGEDVDEMSYKGGVQDEEVDRAFGDAIEQNKQDLKDAKWDKKVAEFSRNGGRGPMSIKSTAGRYKYRNR